MMNFNRFSSSARASAIGALIAAMMCVSWGCSSSSDDDPAAAQQPQVDPRYASAEALLAHVNSLATVEPVKVGELLDLYYAETDAQRRLLDISRTALPIFDLEAAMQERFEQPIDSASPDDFSLEPDKPGSIVEHTGERAVAEFPAKRGKKKSDRVQLVKVGDRWWISGYTIEHHPMFEKADEKMLTFAEIGIIAMAGAAPSMAQRIRGGEFRTAAEARKALQAAVEQYVLDNRERFRKFEAFFMQHGVLPPSHPQRPR